MDVRYIGGDVPWTLPFGDHFYSSSQTSFTETGTNTDDLETIARRHGFEPLYSTNEKQSQKKSTNLDHNSQWMNAGVLFTDKTIGSDISDSHKTDFTDNHGHTFCYLCSINQHHHERTKPRDKSLRRKLIPYNNPKALRARSSSLDQIPPDPNASHIIPYRFVVRTGIKKNSGTRAKVFLYIYGTENDWTSINLQTRTSTNIDGFPSGSIRTFCHKGPDIGQLKHLNVNLIGARSDKEWFLKEIEITNLNTSVTWLCEFNCWLPKNNVKEEHYAIQPSLNPQKDFSLENLSVYILEVRTGGKPFAGTDSNIHVLIRGSTSQTRRLALTSSRSNLFEQNQLDTFAIVGWDIGDLVEITVDSDKSQMASDWDLKEMMMWKIIPDHDRKQVQVYFPFNTWLGKKTSTIKAKKDSYSPADYHPRGPTCYQVAITTGKAFGAGTNANVFLIIYGRNGRSTIHLLDNPGVDDFERGTTSEFTIMDMDVGEIDQIKIWHDNEGTGSAWYLESVIIRKKHSTCRPVTNTFIQRLKQTGEALYRQAQGRLQKIHKNRASSEKENDQRSSKLKDLEDLRSSRSILRSPTMYDKANLQKTVTWGERRMNSQDEHISTDRKRTKHMQKTIEEKRHSSQQIETGHFDHHAYWISSHNYSSKKWEIQSIEEQNSLNFDEQTRSSLLLDRATSNTKIKSTVNEKDDDVYEFLANRWLSKDDGDKKIEVYLTPKSTRLSPHTNSDTKSKSSSDKITDSKRKQTPSPDLRQEKHGHEHSERSSKFDLGSLERSPRSLASLDRSPREPFKTQMDDSRSSQRSLSNTSKRQDESSMDKYHRPSSRNSTELQTPTSSQRDLSTKFSKEPPHYPRPAATSAIDTRPSSRNSNELQTPISSQRDLSTKFSKEPPHYPRPAATSATDTRPSSRNSNELQTPTASQRDLSTKFSKEPPYYPRPAATSAIDTRPSSRNSNELQIPTASQRDLLARISKEPPHYPRSAASSAIDARSSSSLENQRSKPSRFDNEPTSPLPSNRDLPSKTSAEPLVRPKSAVRSTPELSSYRTTRNQVYSSAYGTIKEDF